MDKCWDQVCSDQKFTPLKKRQKWCITEITI